VTNAEEARQEKLSRPVFLAIADEAKKQGLPFAGHVPAALTAAEASDAGQKSIEHLTSVDIECSSQAIELREAWDRALLGADGAVYARDATRAQTRALDSLDGKRCQALAERFARNGTWHDPTLVVLRAVAFGNHDSLTKDSRLRYMPSAIRDSWNVSRNELWKGITPDDFAAAQRVFPRFLEVVRILHRAGVKLLAGSDPPVPYCFPGFSLHDELGLFVQAGLTPLEALQAATRNPAEFLGLRDSLGTVERGKLADLVLLDADPLADIAHTRQIAAVVANGRLLERFELQQMLEQVERAARIGEERNGSRSTLP
jgi:imidazolonepropionase-like amidohydrolase